MTMVPVFIVQFGCTVTDAVGAAGVTGAAFTVTEDAEETQADKASLTVIAYKPAATLLKVAED